jgi:hypothetical protein
MIVLDTDIVTLLSYGRNVTLQSRIESVPEAGKGEAGKGDSAGGRKRGQRRLILYAVPFLRLGITATLEGQPGTTLAKQELFDRAEGVNNSCCPLLPVAFCLLRPTGP